MGNVLRVLGIVIASMLLGLVGLFLLLFTICGGFKSSDGGGVLAICLVLIGGAVTLIVFLGRGLAKSQAATRGLAVAPSVVVPPPAYGAAAPDGTPMITPPSPYAPSPPPGTYQAAPSPGAPATAAAAAAPLRASRPVVPLRPLAGSDLQVLIGLRVALVVYILASIGSMVFNFANFSYFGSGVAIQLILRNIITLVPPIAVLVAVSLRNPPAGGALDATAGLAVASIIFRFGYIGFSSLFTAAYAQLAHMPALLLRMAAYSALEAVIAGLALYLRSRIGPLNPAGLIVATVAFLFWEAVVQAAMTTLIGLMY